MTELLSTLGGKLAERWLVGLLAPGLLFLAAVSVAARLGQSHAISVERIGSAYTGVAADPASQNSGLTLLVAVSVLVLAAVAGLTAAALGRLTERAWLLPGRRRPLRALRDLRLRRWLRADRAAAALLGRGTLDGRGVLVAPGLSEALARRSAVCLIEPDRPTWVADRLRAVDVRVLETYGLDLAAVWPRVWSLASADQRADVIAAYDAYTEAARLAGWAVLYAALAGWWWPSAVVAAAVAVAAATKARRAVDGLAELIESAVDLHGRDLATRLGIECPGPLTTAEGEAVTVLLRKDRAVGGAR